MKEFAGISFEALAAITSLLFILWIATIALAKWMARRDVKRDNEKLNNKQLTIK